MNNTNKMKLTDAQYRVLGYVAMPETMPMLWGNPDSGRVAAAFWRTYRSLADKGLVESYTVDGNARVRVTDAGYLAFVMGK